MKHSSLVSTGNEDTNSRPLLNVERQTSSIGHSSPVPTGADVNHTMFSTNNTSVVSVVSVVLWFWK